MRAGLLPVVLILGACGDAGGNVAVTSGNQAAAPGDNRVECRVGGSEQFERFCTIERSESAEGAMLTLRKPDGGFRRLRVATDGRGVVAADGAEAARVTIRDGARIEVAVGGDVFRLPATVRR